MFLKNKNIIFKIKRSKVTDYAALNCLRGGNSDSYYPVLSYLSGGNSDSNYPILNCLRGGNSDSYYPV